MKPKNNITIIVCGVFCLATLFISKYWRASENKSIAIVDIVRLFDGFAMKKELEAVERKNLESKSRALDSLEIVIQLANKMNANNDQTRSMMLSYREQKADLENQVQASNRRINEQVWKRLNPMLAEMGKQRKMHVIFGANGTGNILYTDSHDDITDETIKYVNQRYAEGN
jgi:Skp family chaperone for outer membrane proteins